MEEEAAAARDSPAIARTKVLLPGFIFQVDSFGRGGGRGTTDSFDPIDMRCLSSVMICSISLRLFLEAYLKGEQKKVL